MGSYEKAQDFMTAWWDDTTWLPFVEGENCNITGPGHQDKTAFAEAVNAWERQCGSLDSEAPGWSAGDIEHAWVLIASNGESWTRIDKRHREAVPVTCLWGAR